MGIISYAQNFEDVLLWRALGHIERGSYIDIGAHDPIVDSVSKAFYERGWRGIHVEPLPVYCDALRRDRPDETVLQAAVSAKTGILNFYEIPDTGISTADQTIAQSHRERGFEITEIAVPCVTLAQVFDLVAGDVVHWLKIDVEGLEEQVLRGWGDSSLRPWIVVVESTLPLTQIEVFSSWEWLLTEKSYSFAHFDGVNRYYVAEECQALLGEFRSGPNVFDGFQFNGTANNPFCVHAVQNALNELDGQIELLKQQASQCEQEFTVQLQAQKVQRLELEEAQSASEKLLREQLLAAEQKARQEVEGVLRQLAQREQEFHAQLVAEKDQFLQIEDASRAREELLRVQLVQAESQARKEIEGLLRQVSRHQADKLDIEKKFAKELNHVESLKQALRAEQIANLKNKDAADSLVLQCGQQARQKTEVMLLQAVQREQEFAKQLLAGKDQIRRLEEASNAREVLMREQLAQAEQEARQEIEALLRQASQREQEFAKQLLAGRDQIQQLEEVSNAREVLMREQLVQAEKHTRDLHSQYDEQRLAWEHQANTFCLKISNLENELQIHRHTNELQTLQHGFEMETHSGEHQRLTEAYSALELRYKAEIAAEHQTISNLRLALAEAQQVITDTYGSLLWRCTEPLRMLLSLFAPKKPNRPIIAANEDTVTDSPASQRVLKSPLSTIPNPLNEQNMLSFSTEASSLSKANASSLDELLACHDNSFVVHAYRTLLGRGPDPEGLEYYLGRLRAGYSKIGLLKQLSRSPEGQASAVNLPGLAAAVRRYELGRLPVIGRLFRLIQETESDDRIERMLRATENRILLLETGSNRRIDQLGHELEKQMQLIFGAISEASLSIRQEVATSARQLELVINPLQTGDIVIDPDLSDQQGGESTSPELEVGLQAVINETNVPQQNMVLNPTLRQVLSSQVTAWIK